MSNRKRLTPQQGPLSGLRIVGSGSAVAMPSALTILGDFGAEIIHIERPGGGDAATRSLTNPWHQEARNRLSMTLELDLHKPEIKEVFMDLIREADVFMENQVWLDKFGIYDEELLEVNPELVIVHISGFGREEFGGCPNYIGKASYDIIGQAFSGYLSLNGTADRPITLKPYTNDFMTALRHVSETGEGQVVDVSQYEAMARLTAGEISAAHLTQKNLERTEVNSVFQPFGLYEAEAGEHVAIAAHSPGVYNRFITAIGFDPEEYKYGEVGAGEKNLTSEKGREFNKAFKAWIAAHSADEVEAIMAENRVPCSKVNTMLDILEHPHFINRNNFVKYENRQTGETSKSFGVFPHMSKTPGSIWRGTPDVGEDTDSILESLGYSEEKIQELRDKKFIQ